MGKCDLTQYQCPQLFVQFKYQLKLALKTNEQKDCDDSITFLILEDSDINDMERYLQLYQFEYEIKTNLNNKALVISLVKGNV